MKVTNKNLEIRLNETELDHAFQRAITIFGDWGMAPASLQSHLTIKLYGGGVVLDVKRDIVVPLVFAERHFGANLPDALIQKLRNKPQTQDTLFELICLGLLSERNRVFYEPNLTGGKVPDLLVLNDGPPVYVECKSHHFVETEYWKRFGDVSSQVCNAFSGELILQAALEQDLRVEVLLQASPSTREIRSLKIAIPKLRLDQLHAAYELTPSITVAAVPRSQPVRNEFSLISGQMEIRTEPTKLDQKDCQVLVYPWPGLDKERRQRQRALLREARLKLRLIPTGSFGMICIQTVSSRQFLPDIHRLIDQEQFNRIPIVWLNPSLMPGAGSRIIFRDGAGELVETIFWGLPNPGTANG